MTRIAVVLSYYPTRLSPHRGMPFYHEIRALSKLADIGVFVTAPEYPKSRLMQPRRFNHRESDQPLPLDGVSIQSVSYPALPYVSRPLNGITCGMRLLPRLADFKPDVVLAYQLYPEAYAAVYAARRLGAPSVVGAIGSDLRCSPRIVRPLIRKTIRDASVVVTVCDELTTRAIAMGAPAQKVLTIRNGCDSGIFRLQDRASARRALGVDQDSRLLVFTGNLVEVKGLADLIQSVAILEPSMPVNVTLIGSGPLKPQLSELSRTLGVGDRVQFAGAQPPAVVAQWLAASDLFCLPSHSEGSPNSMLEALRCGRPVVASNVGGIPELLNPSSGILAPPANPPALAAALKEALTRIWDERLISSLNSRSWDDMARETYETCLAAIHREIPAIRPVSLAS